ncbi:succinylglutamate-semialdehyde dehydrogenase [Legionella impletisoli]|uniref:N-succinylglutamate 5-semialdehyde dehydrogenase n=1 Tax=Legionella impletisoli TaxID=343510 RepID=A0A917JL47_9GAMM|nr:succinylglutamate-semialdehyde dehydrogenase [Legionella impletisoli]GGI75756.1 N-succinylglutamate 5-semialdehyde dehydrogenase [Legionella impletisoli]
MIKLSHFYKGTWHEGHGESFTSVNPVNNEMLWSGHEATEQEVCEAVSSAHEAFGTWASLDLSSRVSYLKQFGNEIEKNHEALTTLISKETGKPLWESKTEVKSVIGKINLSIEAYHERTGEKEVQVPDASGHLRFKPLGVVGVLGPFNFPAHLSNGHIVPALLAGNTVVYKPSELTPAVAEFIVQCFENAKFPPGVLNCVQGRANTAKSLIDQDIQGVYFTGSYKTGLSINKQLSHRPEVLLALEMGGNNPLIIDSISNVKAAIYQSILSAFITAGQRCTCARRLFIADNHEGDAFLSQFIHSTQSITVGPYTEEPEPFMGSVISHEHALSHLAAQKRLIENGGNPLLEMKLISEHTGLLSPGIVDMTSVKSRCDEEIFAPLIQVYRYQDFDHALELANQTQYGLAAGILTDSHERFQQFYQTIRAGLINWNRPTTGAASNLPFGGVGHSGNHRPSAWFAADYCAYPVASLEQRELILPSTLLPGINLS